MKEKIRRNLSRPRTPYLLSGIASLSLALTCAVLLFVEGSAMRNMVAFILILVTVSFSWMSWLAYVVSSRRSLRAIREKINMLERTNKRATEILKREIEEGRSQHQDEYRQQSYNILVSLQELRLATLQQKEN